MSMRPVHVRCCRVDHLVAAAEDFFIPAAVRQADRGESVEEGGNLSLAKHRFFLWSMLFCVVCSLIPNLVLLCSGHEELRTLLSALMMLVMSLCAPCLMKRLGLRFALNFVLHFGAFTLFLRCLVTGGIFTYAMAGLP